MALQKIQFRPGVNREGTNYTNEGGWFTCDKVRFRSGYPEKIGGWTQATPTQTYQGVCRSMVNWVDLNNNNLIGVGTHLKYYINGNLGLYHDITPIEVTHTSIGPSGTNPFTTTINDPMVTVYDTANGANVGNFVNFTGSTDVNGVPASILNGNFQIIETLDANQYTIELPTGYLPTSSGSGGGPDVDAAYEIDIGLPAYTVGNGWGAGIWNGAVVTTGLSATLAYTSGATPWVLLNAISTTINVASTAGFPASGTIIIGGEIITYSGITSTSFTGCTRGVDTTSTLGSTTLSSAVLATDTTIPVASTTGFSSPSSGDYGVIRIDNEVIYYSGLTTTSFTGCVRGSSGTTAATHTSGTAVNEYEGVQHAYRPTAGTPTPVYVYSVTSLTGDNGWGDAVDGAGVGVGQQMRIWTNDNYGQDLLINPRGGPIYYWTNNTSTWPRAEELTTDVAIVGTNQVLVSDVSRFVIAMGCNPYGDTTGIDPMVVRWSDQEDPNTWTPAVTNQAGEQRLSNGSFIMQAKKNRQEIVIWTDSAIYSMQYLGPPYVWGFQLLMDSTSIAGPNSAIVINNVAYWMGLDKFYMYSGTVQTLPCTLRQYVFNDFSFDQRYQTVAGHNEGYNEVWWFYVSQSEVVAAASSNRVPIVDKYVVYNYLERTWYYGSMSRTYWLDTGLQEYPFAAFNVEEGGTILFHESGNDDASTATPVPFDSFVSSSDFDIGDGNNFGFIWRLIPDVNFTGSTNGFPQVYIELSPRNFPGAPYHETTSDSVQSTQQYTQVVKQYIIQQYTQQIYSRVRGRQMSFKIGSGGQLGVSWQLGSPRIDVRPDGKR